MTKEKIKYLATKSLESIKEDGIKDFIKKANNYVSIRRKKIAFASVKDVLIINGCYLPHPSRYRVDHQIEQLEAYGLSANHVNYDHLTLDILKYYRCFIFYRCPMTSVIKKFITMAKSENKKVFFDVDDLVIDTKYTNNIKYIKEMSKEEKKLYDDGVNRMKETFKMCDYAITSTDALAKELKKYGKEVFVNRNMASEEMTALSIKANNQIKKDESKVIIGYLSGSITHNDDFNLILPVIVKLLKETDNLYLQIAGILDVPEELKDYKNRIIVTPFVDWKKLPEIIASIDINLAPLEDSIFNEAKSENKWVEAALCKTVTIASNIGAFKYAIKNGKTGVLCNNKNEWYVNLKKLIEDKKYRESIAETAYNEVVQNNITTYTGYGLAQFINSKLNKNIVFVLPSTNVSGGVNVVIKHCQILKKNGYDVTIFNMDDNGDDIINKNGTISVINLQHTSTYAYFDTMVATLWATLGYVRSYYNVLNKMYLVQGFETNFAEHGKSMRFLANATYNSFVPIKYITISKWCEKWLRAKYNRVCFYAPNGIDTSLFTFKKRTFKGKIKILIEGNCQDYYKNVDESFQIVNKLDKEKFEIHFLSYNNKTKEWYHIDKFHNKVPYDQVAKIYQKCDILLKTSLLESFSYPPLEMMATGGITIAIKNDGNQEFMIDNENCMFFNHGDIDAAVEKITKICTDKELREKLIENGLQTVKSREWNNLENQIINLYKGV